jgi:outer membrane lipoprotein-sorting protein
MKHFTKLALAMFLLWSAFPCAQAGASDESSALLTLLDKVESSYAHIRDYTAIFQKTERVDRKLKEEDSILVKFQKPLKVYMKWLDIPGKEALYVDGENSNKVIAHCPGLLGLWSWSFKPTDPALMNDNRHPITDIGFGYIIEVMRRDIPVALEHKEMEVIRIGEEPYAGRPTTVVEAKFTPHDGRKYYTTRMVCHIDKENMLPIGIACFDEKDALQEQYSYKDVKLNVGLTETDFSKANKEYRF